MNELLKHLHANGAIYDYSIASNGDVAVRLTEQQEFVYVPTHQPLNSLEDLQYFIQKAVTIVGQEAVPHPAAHVLKQADVMLNCMIQSQPTSLSS